ncbi:MAG TPA: cytochrome P450 [Nocardioides sp.]|nr:cytochrome P450 [Nocardioides sp.]
MRPSQERAARAGCPVAHTDYRIDRPAFSTYGLLNAERELAPAVWNDSTEHGFLMVSRYDDVSALLREHDTLVNDCVNAFDPNMATPLLPNSLNPPEHNKLRRVLNPFFSPAAVKRLEPLARRRAEELVAGIAPRKGVDLGAEFAMIYPTELFLALLGLPIEDGAMFLPHVESIFGGFFASTPEELQRSTDAVQAIMAYFAEAVAERERNLLDPETDLVSRLLVAEIDGAPLTRDQILTICMTLMTAGLDTTRSALGYIFHHLATNPKDRARVVADPTLWPKCIEEAVRLYSLIIQDGRMVAEDREVLGCPMQKGDMVWLGLAQANRDPRKFPDPDVFDIDRDNLNHHLGFGAGVHRCIGMHLARAELVIALEAWHKSIPDYHLSEGAELTERGGQLRLQALPLEWS